MTSWHETDHATISENSKPIEQAESHHDEMHDIENETKEEIHEDMEMTEVKDKAKTLLKEIRNSDKFKKLETKFWDPASEKALSEEDKLALYNSGAPTIGNVLKVAGMQKFIIDAFMFKHPMLKAFWSNFAPFIRTLVQAHLLKIDGLNNTQLEEDIDKDQVSFKRVIKVLKIAAKIFAPELLPEIKALEPMVNKIAETEAEIVKDLNQEQETE